MADDLVVKHVPYNGGWVPVTVRDMLRAKDNEIEMARAEAHRLSTVAQRLLDENAALREIVQVVAEARWGTYPTGEHLFGIGDAMGLKLKARALLEGKS